MIRFDQVSFSYGDKEVLRELSFCLETGELLAVMGESGCGKTTLLHLAAGLQGPQTGEIRSDHARVSVAFQEPRLFPWLTVRENLLSALPQSERRAGEERLSALLAEMGLSDVEGLYPRELSGGMKSRVSLARALLYGGDLLLLDEPFSALDEEMRQELATRLRRELKKEGKTAILVTHLRAEAEAFADRILRLPAKTE
ncbi:MAG: ATP-binding cassette domain-containing protein [Clostridia bacterium]|nr:ATP-binding cassette domain-containing protein [Clostridia bacterium]MBQ5612280.1 ATP-binding cassette domain-containing protein [Clostridia bacterium]MBQ5772049.1 ATP-binding cassette domain-containing protein [Clostridia bacterium]